MQLGVDAAHVVDDGVGTDLEGFGDFFVHDALGHLFEDPLFAVAEAVVVRLRGLGLGELVEELKDALGDVGGQQGSATGGLADGAEHLFLGGGLEQVTVRVGADGVGEGLGTAHALGEVDGANEATSPTTSCPDRNHLPIQSRLPDCRHFGG